MIPKPSSADIIIERLKRRAAGLPDKPDGPPISTLDRMLAQAALVTRATRSRGGMSLFTLMNELILDVMLDCSIEKALGGLVHEAQSAYHSAVMAEIVAGRLIVREPICLVRCNDLPEIQALSNARLDDLESMAAMARFAVKKSDAVAWLDRQGIEVPSWLQGPGQEKEGPDSQFPPENSKQIEEAATWSSLLPAGGKLKTRLMIDTIQTVVESTGYPPLAIPPYGKATLKQICSTCHPALFDRDSSFDNAWKELNRLGVIRIHNYEAHCGNPSGRQ